MNPVRPQPRSVGGVRMGGPGVVVAATFASSSLLGFVLLAMMARWLTLEQNAEFLTLWSLLFGIGGALSAVDSESARLASRAHLDHRPVSAQVGLVGIVGALGGVGVLFAAMFFPGVGPILRQSPAVAASAAAMVVLFAPLCMSRGVLLGTGRVLPYAVVVLGEALLRVVLACLLWIVWESPSLYGAVAAIAVGGLAWIPTVSAVRRAVDWRSVDRSWLKAVRSVGALGAANALSTLLLAAYPVLVTVVVGSAQGLQTFFAALILTRLPLVLLAPLQAVAVPWATRALHGGRQDTLRRLWAQAGLALVGVCLLASTAAWFLGPWAVTVFQGEGYRASSSMMALLTGGTCVLAVALLQLAVLVAAERHLQVTVAWSCAVVGAMAWLLLGPGDAQTRGTVGYAVGSLLIYAVSTLGLLSATRSSAD